ncbi:DUF4116 domain-containing protein [Candidatus Comchoanobacter bicostacola]|uniref:DUF4116 domain-containing protein n=1 Tax=Candidatus Comchoanobacter bicostacola TaxID=2919598 RepID=A0ABY5DHQ0_9GAMM|nr:DUF4116 domain-containing protein [Candidatus Comchoanobacter bicostacola]UTC24208.1 DUF4116 domain-containing protein [Candidatus Comchoanobacter bicostacola]
MKIYTIKQLIKKQRTMYQEKLLNQYTARLKTMYQTNAGLYSHSELCEQIRNMPDPSTLNIGINGRHRVLLCREGSQLYLYDPNGQSASDTLSNPSIEQLVEFLNNTYSHNYNQHTMDLIHEAIPATPSSKERSPEVLKLQVEQLTLGESSSKSLGPITKIIIGPKTDEPFVSQDNIIPAIDKELAALGVTDEKARKRGVCFGLCYILRELITQHGSITEGLTAFQSMLKEIESYAQVLKTAPLSLPEKPEIIKQLVGLVILAHKSQNHRITDTSKQSVHSISSLESIADRPNANIMPPLSLSGLDFEQVALLYFKQGDYIGWATSKIRSLFQTTDTSKSIPLNPSAVYELLQSEKARARIVKAIPHTSRFISDPQIATELVKEDYTHYDYNSILSKKAQQHVKTKIDKDLDLTIRKHIFNINTNPAYFANLPPEAKNIPRVYMAALAKDPENFIYLPPETKTIPKVYMTALKQDPSYLMRLNTEIQVKLITESPSRIEYASTDAIDQISTTLNSKDEESQKVFVSLERSLLKYASNSIQEAAIKETPSDLMYASHEVQRNVVSSDGDLLQHASEEIKNDKKALVYAIHSKPESLKHAAKKMQTEFLNFKNHKEKYLKYASPNIQKQFVSKYPELASYSSLPSRTKPPAP